MTYLQSLKAAKEAREQYERDEIRLKVLISQIHDCHIVDNGAFLDSLERFIKLYRLKRMSDTVNTES